MPRTFAAFLAAATAILGLGGLLYLVILPTPDEPQVELPAVPAPPARVAAPAPEGVAAPAAPSAPLTFELVEVVGGVEVRRGGTWTPVQRGDSLLPTEALRTGTDGRALIRAPAGDEVYLRERVKLEVRTLTRTVAELLLQSGRVRASTAIERFSISSGEAQAVAPAGSRFTVFSDQRGAVAVASEVGEVKVIARGVGVTVPAAKQTLVEPGRPPEDAMPVPADVFLSVAWPEKEIQATRATLRGQAQRGAEVLVNGEPVAVGADGSFTAHVPLREGKNRVEVRAESAGGAEKRVVREVTARTTGPPLEADPSRLYENPAAGKP